MSITANSELSESAVVASLIRSSTIRRVAVLYAGVAIVCLTVAASLPLLSAAAAWSQVQDYMQIFGFAATLVLGAWFCWLAQRSSDVLAAARLSFLLWTAGIALRLGADLYLGRWQILLAASALLQAAAFVVVVASAIQCRAWRVFASEDGKLHLWALILMGGGCSMAGALAANVYQSVRLAPAAYGPVFPRMFETGLLIVSVWGFMAPMAWAVSAAVLPELLVLKSTRSRLLIAACVLDAAGIAGVLAGKLHFASVLLLHAAIFAPSSLRVFGKSQRPVTDINHPGFIRLAYVWLRIAATLGVWASVHNAAPIWAASRHLLVVGFVCTLALALFEWAVGRLAGMRLELHGRMMFTALLLLNVGCPLQAVAEILGGQGYVPRMAHVLPLAAAVELVAVLLFGANMLAGMLNANAEVAEGVEAAEEI